MARSNNGGREPSPIVARFDRNTLRVLDAQLLTALQNACEPLGLQVRAAGGRFSEFEFTAKFSITIDTPDAKEDKANKEQTAWKTYSQIYGLKPEWFGKEFMSHGKQYKIVGLLPNRPKYPVVAQRADGKRLLFTAETIHGYLIKG